MKKKVARTARVKRDKTELIIVILASACTLLVLALGLLYQQKERLSNQNYTLEQQYIQQNNQLQAFQDKLKMIEATVTPTPVQ